MHIGVEGPHPGPLTKGTELGFAAVRGGDELKPGRREIGVGMVDREDRVGPGMARCALEKLHGSPVRDLIVVGAADPAGADNGRSEYRPVAGWLAHRPLPGWSSTAVWRPSRHFVPTVDH